MTEWQRRDPHEDRCSSPRCRQDWDIKYSAGATELNPKIDIYLCDTHHLDWIEELDGLRRDTQPKDFAAVLAERKQNHA